MSVKNRAMTQAVSEPSERTSIWQGVTSFPHENTPLELFFRRNEPLLPVLSILVKPLAS
jgi:hypothetical protein